MPIGIVMQKYHGITVIGIGMSLKDLMTQNQLMLFTHMNTIHGTILKCG
jgi:hypothetical protein